jgi:NAD+ synthase (glutamine-hydrolysing)
VPQLRVALAQADPTVGDLAGNAELVVRWTKHAAAQGAHLVAFPEMFLTGYPIEDLALRPSFVDASRATLEALAVQLAAEGCERQMVVVGYLDRRAEAVEATGAPTHSPQNAAAILYNGEVLLRYSKHHLPNYGVFDEARYFVAGQQPCTIRLHGVDVTLAICEDLWQDGGPVQWAKEAEAGLLLVLNGSPYQRNKDDLRLDLVRRRAIEADASLAYLNMVGAQDELVFDGDSLVVDRRGTVLARAPQFEEGLLLLDLDLPPASGYGASLEIGSGPLPPYQAVVPAVAGRLDDLAEVYGALVTGLKGYVRKNNFGSVILGLSGGIDSALVAAIACDALGADRVHAVSLPSAYSSPHSIADAEDLARRTGLNYRSVPIAAMVDAFQASLTLSGLPEENLQARIRGTTLMALSNAEGHLVLATGNKSELAVGYTTLYGDAVGGFAPLKDVPKTMVWALANWRNEMARTAGAVEPIPQSSIDKPPSAELRPGQLDTDSLPEYETLDDVLDDYVEGDRGAAQLIADGFDRDLVLRVLGLVDHAEYKRRQYPPGPKISGKAFGRDRRLPITNAWREQA